MDSLTAFWIEALKKNGEGYLRIEGKSMEPVLNIGERVLIQTGKPEKIENKEIAAFIANGEIIVHRIIDKFKFSDKLYFVHRGDNAYPWGIGIFGEDQLLGKLEDCECTRIRARIHTNILLRKFFVCYFILKQVIKKVVLTETDKNTDSSR